VGELGVKEACDMSDRRDPDAAQGLQVNKKRAGTINSKKERVLDLIPLMAREPVGDGPDDLLSKLSSSEAFMSPVCAEMVAIGNLARTPITIGRCRGT
jgi:hypothetical protein